MKDRPLLAVRNSYYGLGESFLLLHGHGMHAVSSVSKVTFIVRARDE